MPFELDSVQTPGICSFPVHLPQASQVVKSQHSFINVDCGGDEDSYVATIDSHSLSGLLGGAFEGRISGERCG